MWVWGEELEVEQLNLSIKFERRPPCPANDCVGLIIVIVGLV